MIPTTDTPPPGLGQNDQFTTTHWSVVLAARQTDSPAASAALEQLCQIYWYPLYAFVRRQGSSPQDAEDLTQAFFERVLEKCYLADVAQSNGRFRDFLKAALKHFLADCRDRERAAKRGGGKTIIHLDALTAEERYRLEPADALTPDTRFDRDWALTIVQNAVEGLRKQYAADGKTEVFEHMKSQLPGAVTSLPQAEIARRLGKTEEAVKAEASRFRRRFRDLVRVEIHHTVAGVPEIDEELRYLSEVLRDMVG